MDSSDLTREQIEAIESRLVPTLGYLTKLVDRMSKRGFQNDPLFGRTIKAKNAMQELVGNLRSIGVPGMGRTTD